MAFFATWAIWQKLVFILGCAIVVTVILGCAKVGYTHWKSSTMTEKEKIEQAMQRQMSQRRRAGADVPFGIRAIESGIEVEGVWISRPTTPEPSEGSATSKWYHGPRTDSSIDIESQQRPSSNRASRDNYPPMAYTKYTGNPSLQQGPVMDTLEGLEAIYRASGPIVAAGVFETGATGDSLGSSESSNRSPISASAPDLLNSQRTKQQSVDLDLRRMSQAAETGQLTPRVRREHSNTIEQPDYFFPPRSRSPPLPDGQRDSCTRASPCATSSASARSAQIDSLPAAVRKSSLPDVTPFTQFQCLTAPASPLSRPASPAGSISSVSSTSTSSRPSAGERSIRSQPLSVTTNAKPATAQAAPRPSFEPLEKRYSAALRGHGTGFEVISGKKSSFPAKSTDVWQRNAPPISLLNSSSPRPRSNSADPARRKLQKKRRPSAESAASSDGLERPIDID